MMSLFKQLFSLEVWHDYDGGVCPDIEFVVPGRVTRVLGGAGMLAKAFAGRFYVVFRADPTGAPVQSVVGATLRIGVIARDPYFANITDRFDPSSGALHYRNSQLATVLDDSPGAIALREAEPALWREGAFAVVDIVVDPALYTHAPSYQIRLQARVDIWRYYVVAKGFSNADVDQLAVLDQSSGAPARDAITFEKLEPAQLSADEQSQRDALASDGARVLVFRSTAGIPRRATGARQIQLVRNTEAVIERLPQPGKRRGTADLFVSVSKSNP